ncbi:MAG: DUF5666 domain-containing protein [Firmicutes bacterium]|jgi:hypothetical protein|nr:DUF5666 domain-containing protein [Bacillota bacterium]
MNSRRVHLSRRTAGWLVAIFAALVVIHYAYRVNTANLARTVMGRPALTVALRGEITSMGTNQMTVTLEDPHGDLTNLTRQILLTDQTRYLAPGKPEATGSAGVAYLKQGYRVSVRGVGTDTNDIEANLVQVNFPPISGTITQLSGSQMTVNVPSQPAPAVVTLTSHTAFFVPDGHWTALKIGSPVRVWVVPNQNPNSGLTAVTVMVQSP